MTERTTFGHWLKQRRRVLGLTQEQIAQQLPCAVETIRKLESGTRRLSKGLAERLARVLELVGEEHTTFVQVALGVTGPTPTSTTPASVPQTNLLAPLTPLIGREHELITKQELLQRPEVRLLTLAGPPGIGKTRLSQEAARYALDTFRDGVFFVALAPLREPELIPTTIAQALGVQDAGATPLLERLKAALRDRELLLVLDNFEQVVAGANVVAELLAAAPQLKALATSREVLQLYGEYVFPVPPLAVPPAVEEAGANLECLTEYAAVQLFVERARAANPDFVLNRANAAAVTELCVRLEGLPLALELAAARSRLFGPRALLVRLNDRLTLLAGGARNLAPRQQTLRGAIDWSYNLLNTDEQTLFCRLGVFVGGCTLEAIEAVCNPDSSLSTDITEGLAALLDKSLLQRTDGVGVEPRFTMLETIREYALEALAERGEAELLWRRHATYFLGLAEQGSPELWGPDQVAWLNRLEREFDNMRAVFTWSMEEADTVGIALRLAEALSSFLAVRGHIHEKQTWLRRILAMGHSLTEQARAAALYMAAEMESWYGDSVRARTLSDEAIALYREQDDEAALAFALITVGRIARNHGDYTRAGAFEQEALHLYQEQGNQQHRCDRAISAGIDLGTGTGGYSFYRVDAYRPGLDSVRAERHYAGSGAPRAGFGAISGSRGSGWCDSRAT
jgi:predicted ATPase/DNA-binding XRE family transcriptional regulator